MYGPTLFHSVAGGMPGIALIKGANIVVGSKYEAASAPKFTPSKPAGRHQG